MLKRWYAIPSPHRPQSRQPHNSKLRPTQGNRMAHICSETAKSIEKTYGHKHGSHIALWGNSYKSYHLPNTVNNTFSDLHENSVRRYISTHILNLGKETDSSWPRCPRLQSCARTRLQTQANSRPRSFPPAPCFRSWKPSTGFQAELQNSSLFPVRESSHNGRSC